MADSSSLSDKHDFILAEERRFAWQVGASVIDKPKLAVWMILIPVFFIFYFWEFNNAK